MSQHFQNPARHYGAMNPRTVPAAPAAPAVQQAATDKASADFGSQADALATKAGNATTDQKLNTAMAGTEANNAAVDDSKTASALKVSALIAAALALLKFL